jgi:type I restriction enzyme M protein
MREANILYLVVSKFCDVDLHPNTVPNDQTGLIFENLIRRFNELANETAGDHFTPREVIRLMVHILFIQDDQLLTTPCTRGQHVGGPIVLYGSVPPARLQEDGDLSRPRA